ncbi:GPI-GlcNAc transferase complex [Calycina marina]|uniref:GPI-GlcNAc transferase complex n=1 Tax=Calycina marina TaxID=1763456 RepID=A0A9P7Z546_9HELO|nr:GPI-GlcNAc transferase complex [Calycina marina]
MLTIVPHLRTRRPSPTTIEYTVSTSPSLTFSLRILITLTILLRTLIGFSVLLLLYSRYDLAFPSTRIIIAPPFFTDERIWYTVHLILSSRFGLLALRTAPQIPVFILLPLSAAILYLLSLRIHTTESLLVLHGLGIQTSTSSATYLSSATTRFIPTAKIQDVLVNEAFKGFEVRYYLVIVVDEEEDVVVVFPRLLPRRAIVERVWRGAMGCLYAVEGENKMKV